jgi:hypothetical protein
MNTSFHFASAQEITPMILDVIKQAYREKPVSIYIQEDEVVVPQWQIQEVRRRDAIIGNNAACLLDCDTVMSELQKELEDVSVVGFQ